MLAKRIIPCLDVKDGKTVKGVNFLNLRDAGDPVELGKRYSDEGADELVFLDITASHERRRTLIPMVERVARQVSIPFTVGGGISEIDDVDRLLSAGADKISINSSALVRPPLITDIATRFGSQVCVVAIDAKCVDDIIHPNGDPNIDGEWICHINGGRVPTERRLFDWAKEVNERGAGEILFTSMNHDGVKNGFADAALRKLSDLLTIPVIASGGAGCKEHFLNTFANGHSDAALAASVFHFGEIPSPELKAYLADNGINVRL